ncbi:pentapeptide repeat-containing protein [Phormidesmis priestleyi]
MPDSSPHRFANRNLQNRSFKSQNLMGADFYNSDIRGCDFRNAQLMGANFVGVKAGLSPIKLVLGGAIAACIILLVGNAVTRLAFGSLGQIPGSRAWSYVVLLHGFLSVAGVASALSAIGQKSLKVDRFTKLTGILSATLTGGLMGFFYGGSSTNNNAEVATIGAIAGAILMLLISVFVRQVGIRIAIAAAGFTNAYGAAFLLSATASSFLSTRHFAWGIFFTVTSLLYIWLTLISLKQVIWLIKQAAGTSFKNADLTHAQFDQPLRHTDFSGTIGDFREDQPITPDS